MQHVVGHVGAARNSAALPAVAGACGRWLKGCATGVPSAATRFARSVRNGRPSKKMLLAACVASFALSVPVGFLTDGWVTGGRATLLAASAADQARADLAAAICVGRFMAAPDVSARLDALRALPVWYRSVVLEDAGWTALPGMPNLPGNDEPVTGSAELCARRLTAMPEPSPTAAPAISVSANSAWPGFAG
jgi:hypothetical protein